MKISSQSQSDIWPTRHQYHVLTYAEEGFAPLNIHTRATNLTKDELVAFVEAVNERDEVGSLHPRASLSAVPQHAVRSNENSIVLQNYVEDFFRGNAASSRAKKIICDFRTPSVSLFVRAAIQEAASCAAAEMIEELVIVCKPA